MSETNSASAPAGDRLAKVMARAGLCSRRDAEKWIAEGRVTVNGKQVRTPAFNVTENDSVIVDGQPLAARQGTRVWLYHKPAGLVVTDKDPEGRETIYEALEKNGLPRVLSIGRLDINTEGLLLLTNDGGLKRVLELPATGWLRRYRVRAYGSITQEQLDTLKNGIEVEGVKYGPIEAQLERTQGSNVWLLVALREGKNREVKNVLAALGLTVNRLIRVSFGPFQLGDLPIGAVSVVKARVLRDQLGSRLAREAGVDFDAPMPEEGAPVSQTGVRNPNQRLKKGEEGVEAAGKLARTRGKPAPQPRGRTGAPRTAATAPSNPRPAGSGVGRPPMRQKPQGEPPATRRIVHDDGREEEFVPSAKKPRDTGKPERGDFKRGERPQGDRPDRPRKPRNDTDRPKRNFSDRPKREGAERPAREGGDRPKRDFGDRPKRDFGDRPRSPRDGASRPAFRDRNTESSSRPARSAGDGARPERPARPGGRPAAGRPAGGRPSSGAPRNGAAGRPGSGPRKGPGGPRKGPGGPRKPRS